jgi:uncharacterized protein (DUF305 family)
MMSNGAFNFVFCGLALIGLVFLSPNHADFSELPNVDRALNDTMTAMHEAMRQADVTGNADRDFASLMIPHHGGAIEMAKTELIYGSDPRLRRLAQEIIVTQLSEIQLMQTYLQESPVNPNQRRRVNWCSQ